ncbi:hypothetical protein [Actinopolymorpha pittospori]|uniref:Energy-coupling factor transporter ATP-binding protein EcfA2 n=1 Tax=Actinopolymorpha pittospori TaxID=648752 RepID=A0A927MUJ8_9ACTN|nr:hypothetical protein [Actinopolymorpha pittospori]MBE1605098.1 energy-coupling factor transporter ATP-binding protein EcfA2 [Actinopolymorpha pittospori]
MRKRGTQALLLPHGVRALVPVFAASGGSGRSTLAGLLAQALAPTTRTVLVDTSPRAASPWADWLGVGVARDEAVGLPGVLSPPGRPLDLAALETAVVRRGVPLGRLRKDDLPDMGTDAAGGPGYDVLADVRPWTRPPVSVPDDPRWYAQLLQTGGWFAGVVDTAVPLAAAHVAARNAARPSVLDLWARRTDAVPVLVTAATGFGATALARLVTVLAQDGLPIDRMIAVVVNVAGTDPPKWMQGELDTVRGRLAALVRVPYDKAIRADGLARLGDVGAATMQAAQQIVREVAGLVRPQASEERVAYDEVAPAPQSHQPPVHQPPGPGPRGSGQRPQPNPSGGPERPGWVPPRRG